LSDRVDDFLIAAIAVIRRGGLRDHRLPEWFEGALEGLVAVGLLDEAGAGAARARARDEAARGIAHAELPEEHRGHEAWEDPVACDLSRFRSLHPESEIGTGNLIGPAPAFDAHDVPRGEEPRVLLPTEQPEGFTVLCVESRSDRFNLHVLIPRSAGHPVARVTDDVGTTYRLAVGNGPSNVYVPAIAADASTLTIVLHDVGRCEVDLRP
jgi:hypothetical protein